MKIALAFPEKSSKNFCWGHPPALGGRCLKESTASSCVLWV